MSKLLNNTELLEQPSSANNTLITAAQCNLSREKSLIVITILFSALLILSNLAENKVASLSGFYFAGGLLFFPITYILDDIITEVYGFKAVRRVIWLAFCANLIVVLGLWLVIFLDPAPEWPNQKAFETIYLLSPRILLASFVSFLFGEFINAIILAKLKVKTQGKHFWFRALFSTAIGVLIENTLFCIIAFSGLLPFSIIVNLIITGYVCKITYEILALPITYKIAKFLKNKDNIDHFDQQTSFNPLSISLVD